MIHVRPQRSNRHLSIATILAFFLSFIPAISLGEVRFASPFVDHMVLQRGKPLEIWGNADPGAAVEVQLVDQHQAGITSADGEWHIKFKPLSAGGPYDLIVTAGKTETKVHNVLIGDVWLCSGQSNMQFSLGECADGNVVAAISHPNLRIGKVGQAWTKTPQTLAKIKWTAADPTAAVQFSAIAYLFAHELENDPSMKDVPIGVLEDCLGGTVIESWLPQSELGRFNPKQLQSSMFGIGPALLYNGMIAPLGHSCFTGVLWYQGEGNAGEPERYAEMLSALFKSWRAQFDDPGLPILVVQLPDYATDWGGVYWQWIRESQATAVAQTPGTALCVSINTNDGWDLHPQGKHEIARRLALLARQQVYKEKVIGCGPVFKAARVEGAKIIVSFDVGGDKLTAGAGPVEGFMIAGQDGAYRTANAVIDGDSVIVSCPDVSEPQSVRYAWAGVPHSTLTNSSGIPAAPFRTDHEPVSKGHGEAQREAQGYVFKGKDYQITVSAEGVISSLVVRNQQLLSNAPDQWGGACVSRRSLSHLKLINSHCLVCSNNETSLTMEFEDNKMRWTLNNRHPKEDTVFHIAFASGVTVSGDEPGTQTARRKNAAVVFSGIDSVTAYKDIAADDGKVLETKVPAGQTKTIEVNLDTR